MASEISSATETAAIKTLRLSRGHMGLGFMRAKPHAKLERLLLALLLLCYGVGNAYCSTVHDNSRDLHSLLDFKQGITSDPNGVLSSWNTSTHYCGSIGDWVGKLKNIQGLYLEVNNFTGPISSSIGNLSRLARLSLAGNEFEGSIPSSIGNLSQLSVLSLSYNNLQEIIQMDTNFLVGGIPT
ncbi:hypothetical protein GUJ93_ZPchr0006g42882 [Zizania palustris]|uniref:non-specific serine/threonine protein kinase n=1 Tax=Zizania palustris TaxID=103762 RepID=A0A8J5SAU9_ZIZPA|nr:hypothetical protein GUJ93_ZPchr0006g42882 [Zizania palustris]